MPVNARRLIRKMRGGAQSHLLECDDGRFWVVKFRNNPQHRRVLVNEWVASVFLRYLGIAAPDTAFVNLSAEFLAANPDVCLKLGSHRVEVEPGWHFGSAFPGDPGIVAVYDFLPDVLLEQVRNAQDFLGVLAFDKWMGNADARQAIFFRTADRTGYVAQMMDHGYVFDGPHWDFPDSPLQGLYFRPRVYQRVGSFDDFQPWLDRVIYFPEGVVDDAVKQIPPEWLEDDEGHFDSLLRKLLTRRKRVPDLIRESSKGRINPFPAWR